MLQHEQEKAVALLETSPLLSYLFFSCVTSAKTTLDSPVSDHSEELSALKLQSEKVESELAATQAALTEAQNMVESLHEEVRRLKAGLVEDRAREAAALEEKEREEEDLRKEAQKYKVTRYQETRLGHRDLTSIRPSLKAMPYRRPWPTSSSRWLVRGNSTTLTRLHCKPGLMNSRYANHNRVPNRSTGIRPESST